MLAGAGYWLFALGLCALVAAGMLGCGTSSSSPAPATATPEEGVLEPAELKKHPAGSVQQAFLNYWSNLQFQSWADVVSYYDPQFRSFIGTVKIIDAKKLNASIYQLLKPEIVRVNRDGRESTLYYRLHMADGTQELASTTWRKVGGNWEIVYDSRLDAELNQLARNQVEIRRHGSLPTNPSQPPSAAATRAGQDAAQTQARFLEKELHTEQP